MRCGIKKQESVEMNRKIKEKKRNKNKNKKNKTEKVKGEFV